MTWEFILRLFVAAMLGALIGLDREYRAKEAGYRTHFLVAMGSALIMIVSQYGFEDILTHKGMGLDPARIAAQVVSGIGFIGAGTIILQKQMVRGLTTAAGLWATAGIGLAVGSGMYAIGVVATVLTLIGLELLSLFFGGLGVKTLMIVFTVEDKEVLSSIIGKLGGKGYRVVNYELADDPSIHGYKVSMVVKSLRKRDEYNLLVFMQQFPQTEVKKIE